MLITLLEKNHSIIEKRCFFLKTFFLKSKIHLKCFVSIMEDLQNMLSRSLKKRRTVEIPFNYEITI